MALKFLVGSYTSYITALSFSGSSLSVISQSSVGLNPSWVTGHPTNHTVVYSNQQQSVGSVLSFVVNPTSGALTQIDSTPSGGADPAHLLALKSGTELYVTNYSGGSGVAIPLGTFPTDLLSSYGPVNIFAGSGPNTSRQTSPHPHQAIEYESEVLVPDLGSDKVWRLTKTGSQWSISGSISHPPGSGPRHAVAVDSNLYTIHELSNTLTQHTLPSLSSGIAPQLVSTLPIIPPGASNTTLAGGELLLSPKNSVYPNQYLYATNRNDPDPEGDTIAIFKIKPSLQLVTHVRTGLNHIRGAMIGGPNGEYLVAAGKDGGGIVVYRRTNGGTTLMELARNTAVTQPTSVWFF